MKSHVKFLRECESTISSNNGEIAKIVMKPRILGTFVKNILSLMTAITNSYLQGKEENKFLDDDNGEKMHSLKLCQTWIDEILKLKDGDESRYGPKGMILDEVSATCYHKIGIYHLHTGDTDESKENLIKEKEILVELRSYFQIDKTIGSRKDDWSRVTERLLYCESALGETFDNNGDDTDALKCYCRARAIFDEPDYKHTGSDMKPLWRRHELLKKKGKKKSRKRKTEDDVKIKQENIKSEPEDEDSTDDEEDYEFFPSSSSSFSSSSSSNSSPPPPPSPPRPRARRPRLSRRRRRLRRPIRI